MMECQRRKRVFLEALLRMWGRNRSRLGAGSRRTLTHWMLAFRMLSLQSFWLIQATIVRLRRDKCWLLVIRQTNSARAETDPQAFEGVCHRIFQAPWLCQSWSRITQTTMSTLLHESHWVRACLTKITETLLQTQAHKSKNLTIDWRVQQSRKESLLARRMSIANPSGIPNNQSDPLNPKRIE